MGSNTLTAETQRTQSGAENFKLGHYPRKQPGETMKTLHKKPSAVESISLQPIPKSFRGRPDKFAKSGRKMTLACEASPQGDVSDRQVCI